MELEYLAAYGVLGDFGRFRAAGALACRRGDRVVIRTGRGLELGEILRPATAGHAHFLPNTSVGPLLRLATPDDERQAVLLSDRVSLFCAEATSRATELELPIAILDAELLLDEHAVLHYVRWQDCDLRPLVSGLSRRFDVGVLLQDLTRSEPAEHSCGSCGSGGCGDCGSGGGCSSCGTDRAHFAGLREQMLDRTRVPLL